MSLKEVFEGKNGTVLFYVVLAVAAIFVFKVLPTLISLGIKLVVFGGLIYLIFRLFGKNPMDLFGKK